MILSDEPGYYKQDHYGIRVENLILIREPEAIDVELSRRVHIRFSRAHSIDRRERRGAR